MSPLLPLTEIDRYIDVLDRTEPGQPQASWRSTFDILNVSLARARRIRRLWSIPVAIAAALGVIVLHGAHWDFDDARNVLAFNILLLVAVWWLLEQRYPILQREGRVGALLRYYGADILEQESALA